MRAPMPTAVIEARRNEPSPANIEHDCAECYLQAISAALAGALRDVGPTLIEPRSVNPDRAVRVLGSFVETMTGFALGAIAHHLTSGMRRWFGDDGIATMRSVMHGWPAPVDAIDVVSSDARRPLVGEALGQLHARFSLANKQARALVEAVPNRPMTAMMLSLLAQEDTIQRRIGDELARGWTVYTAAVTTKRYPALNPLWQGWQWQLDGKPVLTRDENTQAGYIMLVR
jgi:hypothetical protein